ncbi:galactose-3-O-sulfotransferase 2-like [Melanerpes formicivorus]|uniref:galactose-3-O-sulfotransferase 2-like n=1 Tax=Melanerpes formicivorus TaxID=211600 RepID=UPI00358EF315
MKKVQVKQLEPAQLAITCSGRCGEKGKLKAIYRCQPGWLWTFFSLLILLLFTLQVVEKLQPSKSCRCELERALQQTTDQSQLTHALQTLPELVWEDDYPPWQRKAMPEPASTESLQDVFQMQLYFSQKTPLESPDSQEEHWTWQPTESSKKVKVQSTGLKSQLLGPRKATREGPSTSLPGKISTVWGDDGAATSKFIIFANRMTTEEHRRISLPELTQVMVESQSQPQARGSPYHQWGSSPKHAVPSSAQLPQAEDFYRTELERGFFPSWTEASKVEEMTLGEEQQARGVSSQEETCEPKTDVVFLKVHKSASSTVMNILFRFGETHNLTFAFPVGGGNQLFYPRHFLARFVQGFSTRRPRRFNILCHHMRFLQPEVQKVVSHSAVYFSILRNPVQLMESSFVYYKGASAFSRAHSLEEFLRHPYLYYNPASKDSHYARNLMTFDFGFNPNGEVSAKRVQLMLEAIEASFDLLLISEYFDESMVLLKEMLCWDLDSVIYFPLNSRDSSTKSPLPDTIVEKIKNWNRLDWEIYTHFNRTFWERVDRDIGRERMQQEVKALRARQAELARTCLQGRGSVAPKDIKDSSLRPLQHGNAKILGYNLKQGLDAETERMCRRLVTPELQYSSALYKRQFPPKHPQSHQPPPSQQGNAPWHRLEGSQN